MSRDDKKNLPCPFCGNPPSVHEFTGDIICDGCMLEGIRPEIWNRRVETEPVLIRPMTPEYSRLYRHINKNPAFSSGV